MRHMLPTTGSPLNAEQRALTKQWLAQWRSVGPILERMRWTRLHEMTNTDASREALLVWGFWQRDWPSDDGRGLSWIAQVQRQVMGGRE